MMLMNDSTTIEKIYTNHECETIENNGNKNNDNNVMDNRIYFDYQASTPCDKEVLETMLPYFSQVFGNPHARSHSFGWEADAALEKAREQVGNAINADKNCIIFTSGATESNNLGLKGLAAFWQKQKKHIITTEIEHKCVVEALKDLERAGWEITYLHVDKNGFINPADVEAAIREDTLCVTIAAVNHEIGTIQPIKEIGAICKKKNVFLHVDAAQALGKLPIDVEEWNVDLMSLSAHKTYGPKGVGALYLRTQPKRVRLKPLNSGGGQERGMRSGTTPVPLCVGMGKACELFCGKEYLTKEWNRLRSLQLKLHNGLKDLTYIILNGPELEGYDIFKGRIPHNYNISVAAVEGESLMMYTKELAYSSGSACTSANLEPSYVLRALDVQEDLLHSSVRISFGKETTEADIDYAIKRLRESIIRLREVSPIWDMILEGGTGENYLEKWSIEAK